MNRDHRFPPSGEHDHAAAELGRFWDAFVADSTEVPAVTPEIADLADAVRRLHTEPRDPAPAAIHDRVRALIEADPAWWQRTPMTPVTVDPNLVSPNGRAQDTTAADIAPTSRPTPIRRLWPIVELIGLAAAILVLVYLAFGRDHETAVPTTPTPPPVATGTTVVATATAVPGVVGDWPMLGGGPSRSAGTDRQLPATAPSERWNVTVAPDVRGVVAAGDKVFVTDGGTLYALDFATGAERWRFDLGVKPSLPGANPPAVAGGVAYVGANGGTVYAIDVGTGEQLWEHQTGGTITTAVAVGDGLVFAGTVNGASDGYLFALDATTGEQRWKAVTGPIGNSSPVISDDAVYVGGGGNRLYSFDAASGAERWHKELSAGMRSVAVGDGIALAGSRTTGAQVNLVALDTVSLKNRWTLHLTTELTPAIVGDTVFVVDNGGKVQALTTKGGTQKWQFLASLRVVDFAVVSDSLLMCRKDGVVIALAAAGGTERWRLATGSEATGVAVGAGTIYVAHKNGTVEAYG